MKIAIIGAGNMGGAIARGLAKGSIMQACDIRVSNPSPGKLQALKAEFPDMYVTQDNQEAVTGADYIMLCVKPWLVKSVLKALKLNAITRSKQFCANTYATSNRPQKNFCWVSAQIRSAKVPRFICNA